MRTFLVLDFYLENYRSVQPETIQIQGTLFEIIYNNVWLNDKNEEIPDDQANNTSLYRQSPDQENLRIFIEDESIQIVKTPKFKSINTETNEEERVYRDVRMNVETTWQMKQRLISKITNSQNIEGTPPPNSVFGPEIGTINIGPSISNTNTNTNPNRPPLGEQI